MKRFSRGLLMWALLLLLVPFSVGGCKTSCGCASTPDPNWTPAPIGTGEAAIYAAKVAGVPSMTVERIVGPKGRTLYRGTASNTIALVDGDSGLVEEVVLEDRIPDSATVSVTATDARTPAEAFMERTGTTIDGFRESVQLDRQAGVAAWDVEWTERGSVNVPKYEVSVNASTGSVFAFVDLRMLLGLTPPVIGRQKAFELAIAALGQPDAQVASADFTIDFPAGTESSTWTVGFGEAGATASDGAGRVTLVRVDAVTGVAALEA